MNKKKRRKIKSVNFLLRAYIIQEYYKLKSLEGLSNRWIYERLRWWYPMSEGTFYNYLAVPARKGLKAKDISENLIHRHLEIALQGLKMIEENLKQSDRS